MNFWTQVQEEWVRTLPRDLPLYLLGALVFGAVAGTKLQRWLDGKNAALRLGELQIIEHCNRFLGKRNADDVLRDLVAAFPGLVDDTGVNAADLVQYLSINLPHWRDL